MIISPAYLASALDKIDDGVSQSDHPTSKVMAVLVLTNGVTISSVNYFPTSIVEQFGQHARIGNRSGSIHAEIAALCKCYNQHPYGTHKASMVISDPPCADCALAISLAGIENVYIHPSGFKKHFALNSNPQDLQMSSKLLEYFGVGLFSLIRKGKMLHTIPLNDTSNRSKIRLSDSFKYLRLRNDWDIASIHQWANNRKYLGSAIGQNSQGDPFIVISRGVQDLPFRHHKYDISGNPLGILMGGCQRHGLRLVDGTVHIDNKDSPLPTRTFLNFLASDHRHISMPYAQDHPLLTPSLIEHRLCV